MAPKQQRGRNTKLPADGKPKAARKGRPKKSSQEAVSGPSNVQASASLGAAAAPPQPVQANATADPTPTATPNREVASPSPPAKLQRLRIIVRLPPGQQTLSRIVVLHVSPDRLKAFPHKKKAGKSVTFDLTPRVHQSPSWPDTGEDHISRHWNKRVIGKGETSVTAGLHSSPPKPSLAGPPTPPRPKGRSEAPKTPRPTLPAGQAETLKKWTPQPDSSPHAAQKADHNGKKKRKRRKPRMENSATPTPQTPAPAPAPPRLEDLSPHLFDIAPQMERLLSRLLLPAPPMAVPAPGDTPTAGGSAGPAAAAAAAAAKPDADVPEHRRHLDVKDLDAAANAVRANLHRARAAVLALPDVDRSVEQQRREAALLESRIRRMAGMLQGLRDTVEADVVADRRKREADAKERE